MVKRHLSRLNAPKNWPIIRKGIKFIARPSPGPHALNDCITLNLVLKELLKYCKTTREVKKILNSGKVLVDGKIIKDHKFPIGIMDVIEISDIKEQFLVIYNEKGKFILKPIKKEESGFKVCKITGKNILKKGKIQLNLYDGKNLLVKKDGYKVGDSIIIDLKNKAIKKHLKFSKDALIYIFKGSYTGKIGVVKEIKKYPRRDIIIFKINDKEFETLKNYVFIIDKTVM